MPEQVQMPAPLKKHLQTRMMGQRINDLTVTGILGAGNTAVTYLVEDESGIPWALKLVTRESYGERAPFREVGRFARCKDDRFLVFPKQVSDWEFKWGGHTHQFVSFKSRPVAGSTLGTFLQKDLAFNGVAEISRFVMHIAAALTELSRLGFAHGDLHDRNVMREVLGEDGPAPDIHYVVIDMSEAYPVGESQGGLRKDLQCVGDHLRAFADALYRRDTLSREDEIVLRAIEHIPGLLDGVTAESIGIGSPVEVLQRFQDALRQAEESPRKLQSPFDALSAENILNDELLVALSFTASAWAPALNSPENVLFVGPRGCGKTMMFRRSRFKTKILARRETEVLRDDFIGLYLPCESLFYNRFSDLSDSAVDRNREALVAFFNMAVTQEVASTLAILPITLGSPPASAPQALQRLLADEVGSIWQQLGMPAVITTFGEIASSAERLMRFLRRSIAYGEPLPAVGSPYYVATLVEAVKREVPFIAQRRFVFFLDDYTEERVPLALQRNLHPIVGQRSGHMCFKISAHTFGSIYSFPQPLALDEGRNISVVNLGSEYVNRKRKKAEGRVLIRIMNDRFRECEGYDGKIEEWLGKTRFPGGVNLNRMLNDSKTRGRTKYHGIECLTDLCTGDISEMIRMVGAVFREARIEPGSSVREIDPATQDRAIRTVSREFVARVRNIRPDGQRLYDVLNAFGTLSQRLLHERDLVGQGKDKRGRARKDPYDLLTIYVDDLTKARPPAVAVWQRLQRASIFVDIRVAPSQRAVIADRVTMRRIYSPAFSTTLTSSEHLQATKDGFDWFMDEPAAFAEDYYRRTTRSGRVLPLFASRGKRGGEPDVATAASMPSDSDQRDFMGLAPSGFVQATKELPALRLAKEAFATGRRADLFVGAMGFEERTSAGATELVKLGTRAERALLLEFDMYYEATEKRRESYAAMLRELTGGEVYRPLNAPVGSPDPTFAERMRHALRGAVTTAQPKIIFDCTSCPSLILSKCLAVLLDYDCDLTILYSEASKYYPTRAEWEQGKLARGAHRVEGPFSGIRFVERPLTLQADDVGERPVLAVLFPTFNAERTSGVLAEIDPARRVWLIGVPHSLPENAYRTEMAKELAAPVMYPGDAWAPLTTFDYRDTLRSFGGIFAQYRFHYRMVTMPHGSKMQTLGVNLFAVAHQLSMVFAMPKTYVPERYSEGCAAVWAVTLGDTGKLREKLRSKRVIGGTSIAAG